MECETNDCRKEKLTCVGCFYSDKEQLEDTRIRNKKICKNCKYYEKGEFAEFYGECSNPRFEYETASCYERYKKEQKKPILKDKLFYMDYEGYDASIEVGEEFGCIHFENKE